MRCGVLLAVLPLVFGTATLLTQSSNPQEAATVNAIGTARVESKGTPSPSDGDFAGLAVSEITGTPGNLSGATISRGDQVGSVWSGAAGTTYLATTPFGAGTGYVHHEVTVKVPDGVHELTVYAGFNAPNLDTWIQVDDFTVN
jgi:hypothetical protein